MSFVLNRMHPFKYSLLTVHSLMILVFVTFIMDVLYEAFLIPSFGVMAVAAYLPVKVMYYAGIIGVLIEIVSGEQVLVRWERIKHNIRSYWWLIILVAIVPFLINMGIAVIGQQRNPDVGHGFTLQIRMVLIYVLVHYVVHNKYGPPQLTDRNLIGLDVGTIMAGLFLYGIELVLHCVPKLMGSNMPYLPNIVDFILRYWEILVCVFLARLELRQYPNMIKSYEERKEVYLINPMHGGIVTGIVFSFIKTYPPLFVVLKALTPKDYSFREFNRTPWKSRYYKPNKLVAITCYTSNCYEAYRIAKKFKSAGAKVVMGGPHISYLPKEALQFCDSVVVGEVEGVWKDVIDDYENDCLKSKYVGHAEQDFYDEVHQELMSSPPHIIKDFLETTRGCKFKCHFCTIPGLSGGQVRRKPVFQVVELLKKVRQKYKSVEFIDNNIYNDPGYAKALFEQLKPLNIKWGTQCTIDIAKNTETLRLAKESGCEGFLIGYEIDGNSFEDEKGGKFSMAKRYKEYSDVIKKAGITIKAHFIFGFGTDTFQSALSLWKFCFSINPKFAILSLLTPLPGSQLYYDTLKDNRIVNLNWKQYHCQALVMDHPKMNNFILGKTFPILRIFFLFTTSSLGRVIFGIMLVVCFL